MRRLVEPSPVTRCGLCGSELFLACIQAESTESDRDVAVYSCGKCENRQVQMINHDPYTAQALRKAAESI
jgi:hypothetical protein